MSIRIDSLRDVDGADARVIARLDAVDFSIEYVRDDLESKYSDVDLEEAYRLIMANRVTGDDFEDIIQQDFEAQTLFFDDIVVFVIPARRYEAVFASFDRHESFPVGEIVRIAADR